MPTPSAVLEGVRLIAEGIDEQSGFGPLVLVDVGGATTDIYSVSSDHPKKDVVIRHGLPEPFLMRTVEGDLGMRYNIRSVVESVGLAKIASYARLPPKNATYIIERFAENIGRLPESKEEWTIDATIAHQAIRLAMERHAGVLETVYTVNGSLEVQCGKDLRDITLLIGTGGVLAHSSNPAFILRGALADPDKPLSLAPRRSRLLLDRDYIVYAIGLISTIAPHVAITLARQHLQDISEETSNERNLA